MDRSASEADIKKAYKKLSRKFHPDKNKSPGAEERFVEITQGMSTFVLQYNVANDQYSLRSPVRPTSTPAIYTLVAHSNCPCRKSKYTTDMEKKDLKPMKEVNTPLTPLMYLPTFSEADDIKINLSVVDLLWSRNSK